MSTTKLDIADYLDNNEMIAEYLNIRKEDFINSDDILNVLENRIKPTLENSTSTEQRIIILEPLFGRLCQICMGRQ